MLNFIKLAVFQTNKLRYPSASAQTKLNAALNFVKIKPNNKN